MSLLNLVRFGFSIHLVELPEVVLVQAVDMVADVAVVVEVGTGFGDDAGVVARMPGVHVMAPILVAFETANNPAQRTHPYVIRRLIAVFAGLFEPL